MREFLLRDGGKLPIAGIADGDQDVTQEAGMADAFDRRTGEKRAERRLVERGEHCEPRRDEIVARLQLRFARRCGKLVPWTNRKAIIAAVNAVADHSAKLARNLPAMLDRQIRNAAPRIETIRCRKSLCRADIETGAARAAMILLGSIRREIERRENRTEKQPRAEFARNQIRVLALPADAGRRGERLLHHRRGVDENLDVCRHPAAALGLGHQP